MSSHPRRGLAAAGLACTLSVLAGSAIAAEAQPTALRSTIRWSNGMIDQVGAMSPAQVRQAVTQLAARPEARRVQITLDRPVTPADRVALRRAGIELLSPIGGTSYFASVGAAANADAAARSGVLSVRAIDATRKMHADVLDGRVRAWTIVGEPPEKIRARYDEGVISMEELRKAEADPVVATVVMFHRDADLAADPDRVAAGVGGQVVSRVRSINAAVVHAPASRVQALAADDAVMWIEPPLPALQEVNAQNRVLTGVDTVNSAPYALDGTGVNVLVYDGGAVANHGDLAGRLTVGPSDTSGTSDHATHVAGTVGGSGAGNANHRGMAPGVHIISYGFEQPGGLSPGFLYTDPGDLEADYTAAITQFNAHVSNNSIGTNTEPNGYPCEWQGNYGATSALIDAIARGSIGGSPFRIVWANGNERQGSRCDVEGHGDFYSTAPPAGAKNHIAVGSVDSDTDLTSSFSSWGPVDDGRIKPDVSAPGCQAGGDFGVTSLSSSGSYTTKCGTSMAAPTVTGIAALILEQWRLSFPGTPDPRNATLKAILANSAQDRGNPGPDYQYGYGSVRAPDAVDTVMAENVVEAEVGQGEVYRFVVIVGPEDSELKVTIAWDDPSGVPNVNPVLVNDLDLRVIGPDGSVHMPWTLNPANPGAPAVRTARDGVNNIEQVVVDNPLPGGYTVEVAGFNVADGPSQTFGAASNGYLVNCSSAGLVSLGATVLPCEGSVNVQVIDCDLNLSDSDVDFTQVLVSSTSQPGGVTIDLAETAAESAAFLGSFTYSSTPGADLLVAPGDEVTVTYVDADNGEGQAVVVSRSVLVDCTPPVVTSAYASDVQPREATVEIETDEPTTVTVAYGESMGALSGSVSSGSLGTSHSVLIPGLQDDTTYHFVVSAAVDAAGNASSDDNAGAGYSFTTPEIPDFFTEQFTSGISLQNKRIEFRPNGTFDFYAACVEPLLGQLPVDPAGGVVLPLGDDQPQSVTLSGGAEVSLYGESYTGFYVGPNGYVTFGSGDSTYSESLSAHFSMPRVSALFDDLNPSSGGTVSWKQLSDRAVVSYVGVREYNTTNSNTFQIELFFDGRIAISYLGIAVQDAIIGLSAGEGLSPDFYPSILDSYASCGPRPPFAGDLSVQTEINAPVTIALDAADDGEPGPLSYSVLSLPESGVLVDLLTGAPIQSTPHPLAGGSNLVEYRPALNSQGQDAFTYAANDGGAPPEGGPSNVATVSVTVGGPQAVYEFLVDDSNPGWATTGAWAFGQPTGSAGDPSSGHTGQNVYGYNLSGAYTNNMQRQFLTSGSLDFTGMTDVTLEFSRWLGVESSSYDQAALEISVGGGAWQTVWQHSGPSFTDPGWTRQTYDISGVADDQSDVRVRWVMGTTDNSVTYCGWNVDDVVFTAIVPFNACPADFETPLDGQADLFDLLAFVDAFSTEDPAADLAAPYGKVDLFDLLAYLDFYAAGCP